MSEQATAAPLAVVEESFDARAGGVHVRPKVTLTRATRAPFGVVLRLPDGRERDATATLDVMHVRGPLPPYGMLRLHGLAPADVPPGTAIYEARGDEGAAR